MQTSVAVLAGTPVDTQMGVDVLAAANLPGLAFPLASNPWEQTAFQISSPAEKWTKTLQALHAAQAQGCKKAFVYCNSLSASVDFSALAAETGMKIITPLDVYRQLATNYQRLAFIAANAQGLAGIEKTLLSANPNLELRSAGLLPVVLSIEAGLPPEQLVAQHHLVALVNWFEACGAEALLLGCTHFPYFKAELSQRTILPLIDPADEMLQLLMN